MYKFYIEIEQNLEYAKKNFPKVAYYMAYRPACFGVYSTLISMIKLRLKKYKPREENGKHIVEELYKTKKEAEEEKTNLDNFFFSDIKDTNLKEEMDKAKNNRTIKGLIRKHKDKLVDKLTGEGQVINFLNKFSIYVKWGVKKVKK